MSRCHGNNRLGERCCLDEGHNGDHVSWEETHVNLKCLKCAGQWRGPFDSSCPHCAKATAAKSSILSEAAAIISGPRRESYGPVTKSFAALANVWSEILDVKLKEQLDDIDVAKLMIALKLMREANAHNRDNLVDICGYAALLEQLHAANPTKEPSK